MKLIQRTKPSLEAATQSAHGMKITADVQIEHLSSDIPASSFAASAEFGGGWGGHGRRSHRFT